MYIKQKGQGETVTVVITPENITAQEYYDGMPDKELFELVDGDPPEGAQELIYSPAKQDQ